MSESGIRFIQPPTPNERILAYELDGRFTADDMRSVVERLEKISNGGHKALLYQDMTDLAGVDLRAITEKLKHMGALWRAVGKVAIVGDERWLEIYVGIMDHLTPQDLRYFDASDKDAAFAWLTA